MSGNLKDEAGEDAFPSAGWAENLARIGCWAVAWKGAESLMSAVAERWSPAFAALETKAERRRVELVHGSLLHAVLVTGYGVYHAYESRQGRMTDARSVRDVRAFLQLMSGYFVNDFVGARRDWAAKPDDFVHHILALLVLPPLLFVSGEAARSTASVIPQFFLVEGSTIALDVALLHKAHGIAPGRVEKAARVAFVLLFVLLRVVNLPRSTLAARRAGILRSMGRGRYALYGANAIQFYWLALILKKLLGARRSSTP